MRQGYLEGYSKGTDAELIEMLKCQKGFTDIRIDMLRAIEY